MVDEGRLFNWYGLTAPPLSVYSVLLTNEIVSFGYSVANAETILVNTHCVPSRLSVESGPPPGKVPPVEKVTLRSEKEMEPYLREPLSKGWKSVYGLTKRGF